MNGKFLYITLYELHECIHCMNLFYLIGALFSKYMDYKSLSDVMTCLLVVFSNFYFLLVLLHWLELHIAHIEARASV